VGAGGCVLVLAQEGGDRKHGCNLNEFTRRLGITINNDLVIRTSYYKYMHPTEALVSNGILSEEVIRVCNGETREAKPAQKYAFLSNIADTGNDDEDFEKEAARGGLDFLYVQGASLTVSGQATPVLSSGPLSYPSNRPVGAVWHERGKGRVVVIGSCDMFQDDYFEVESNAKIFDFVVKYLLTDEVDLLPVSADADKEGAGEPVPDIAELADKLKSCFQENEDAAG
jgi:intraflagellar transport protein 52